MPVLDLTFNKRTIALLAFIVAMGGAVAAVPSAEIRSVLWPVAVAIAVATTMLVVLWNREGVVPIFDVGCIAILAVLCYTIIPPLQYVASGMQHTIISAFQFWVLQPSTAEMVALTWKYTAYTAALAIGYLALRSKVSRATGRPVPEPGDVRFLLISYVATVGLLFFFKQIYGVSTSVTYAGDALVQNAQALSAMPVFLRQTFNLVLTVSFMLKVGLLLVLFLNWRNRVARILFLVWVLATAVGYLFEMGARSELILTVLASMIIYHRFVRPLRFLYLSIGGVVLLAVFLFLGIARGEGNVGNYLNELALGFEYRKALLSMQNEFQVLFAGTYDLWWLKQNGVIRDVPLQFLFYDIVMLLPQQLLPFTKIDVQQWYVQQSTAQGFFMYNPVAQSILGFGWVELVLRGLMVGAVFAAIRNWYVRNSGDFWKTLFYAYLIVMCYYGARGTALYFFAHKLIYTMLPVYLLSRVFVARSREPSAVRPVVAPAAT